MFVVLGCASEPPREQNPHPTSTVVKEPPAPVDTTTPGHVVEDQILELVRLESFGLDEVAAVLSARGPHGNEVLDFGNVPRIYDSVRYWKNDQWVFVEGNLASPASIDSLLLQRLLEQLEGGLADGYRPPSREDRYGLVEFGGDHSRHAVELWVQRDRADPMGRRVLVARFQVLCRVK